MTMLRGLKLNCILAALLPAILACLLLLWLDHQARQRSATLASSLATDAVRAAATAIEAGATSPAVWLAQHDAWACISLLTIDDNGEIVVLDSAGRSPDLLGDAPPPELTDAVTDARSWHDHLLRAAAPVRDADGNPRALLYIEFAAVLHEAPLPLLPIAACLLGGLLMAWYLATRIYRPIVALHSEAERALRGEAAATAMATSAETSGIASSICELARVVRSGQQTAVSRDDERPHD